MLMGLTLDTMSEDFVVVFAGSAMEADVMKTSLEAAGIDAFVTDELTGSLLGSLTSVVQVRVQVKPADAEEARALIEGPTVEVTGESGD